MVLPPRTWILIWAHESRLKRDAQHTLKDRPVGNGHLSQFAGFFKDRMAASCTLAASDRFRLDPVLPVRHDEPHQPCCQRQFHPQVEAVERSRSEEHTSELQSLRHL